MKYDFDKLLTGWEFAEIKRRIERGDVFEFERFDKPNKINLRIGSRRCDYEIWQGGVYCFIDGDKKFGDCHGFGHPYQRAEFLKLTYDEVIKLFACYGYSTKQVKQLDIFTLFGLSKMARGGVS